jgi:uncharacterized protein YfaS (alpha-2-macroglobulin family)
MQTRYDNGDLVRCTAAFTDTAGTAIDPTTVSFRVKDPAGTITTYAYGTDSELVKDSTGNYHVDIDANTDGIWAYRFSSTGAGQAAAEATFRVNSLFA